jgi:hypothetical protein
MSPVFSALKAHRYFDYFRFCSLPDFLPLGEMTDWAYVMNLCSGGGARGAWDGLPY